MAQFLKVSDSIVYSSLIVILYHKEAKRLIELWFVVILISPVFPWLSLLCLICLLVPDSVTMLLIFLSLYFDGFVIYCKAVLSNYIKTSFLSVHIKKKSI